jgi:DNA-directed RNA polymerase subunit RPC12/RpoP
VLSSIQKRLNVGETGFFTLEAYLMSEKLSRGLTYECVKCGAKVKTEELELRGGGVKCTFCGYRVLKKKRPPVVKRVSTG